MAAPQAQSLMSNVLTLNSQTRRDGPQKVFVYGTLKRGFGNHGFLGDAKELGVACIDGIMFHLGGIPAIHLGEPFSKIMGEVYEVPWDTILDMDGLEGVSSDLYTRIEARVHPHGVAWMYTFPYRKIRNLEWIVADGIWKGPETPKAKWAGFGRGIRVDTFEADMAADVIKVGTGTGTGAGTFELRRSLMDNSYKLLNSITGEVLGSYKHLRNMTGTDGKIKPVLRLPAVVRTPPEAPTVISAPLQGPTLPVIWTPPDVSAPEPEERPGPQATRLMGIKFGEA